MFPISRSNSSSFNIPDNDSYANIPEYTESLSILLKGDSGFGTGFKNFEYRKEFPYEDGRAVEEELINFKALEFSFSFLKITLGFDQIIEGNVKIRKTIMRSTDPKNSYNDFDLVRKTGFLNFQLNILRPVQVY